MQYTVPRGPARGGRAGEGAQIALESETMETQRGTFHILTWGCQMNEDDSEQMALFMEQAGYQMVGAACDADVVLLNTCSVRRKPEDKVYSKLGELAEAKRFNPHMVIAVCGCMAEAEAEEIGRRAPSVDLIVGPGRASEIPSYIEDVLANRQGPGLPHRPAVHLDRSAAPGEGATVPLRAVGRPVKLRAYVPVMYGCDRYCTFCIVPLTRGKERSRPADEIVREIRSLALAGTREVTLLGQTVNSYGRGLPERTSFAQLLRMIGDIPGIERIRFTSPHPRGFTEDVIAAIAEVPAVCEHVHLPLQAADDALLRRMRRGYTVERYWNLLCRLREAVPGVAVTTDIMLGFPGETDSQFDATMEFVRRARFDAAFMFAYSPRRGTPAAEMEGQVPHRIKIERLNALIALQNGISEEINRSLVGTVQEVLVEGRSSRNDRRVTGHTRTFKTTHVEMDGPNAIRAGELVSVRVTEGGLTGLFGVPERREA